MAREDGIAQAMQLPSQSEVFPPLMGAVPFMSSTNVDSGHVLELERIHDLDPHTATQLIQCEHGRAAFFYCFIFYIIKTKKYGPSSQASHQLNPPMISSISTIPSLL